MRGPGLESENMMSQDIIEKIFELIELLLIAAFVLGLAESICSGAAGFWGGLPFWVICFAVLPLVLYDYWIHASARSNDMPTIPMPCPLGV